MYIIKVKGKAKIPDYIQLRDEAFVLIAYFRADRPLKDLHRYGLEGKIVATALGEQLDGLMFHHPLAAVDSGYDRLAPIYLADYATNRPVTGATVTIAALGR